MPLGDSPTRRRGKMSLLIRRDATLRIPGAPHERDFVKPNSHLSIFEQPDKNDQQRANGLCVGGRE